MKTTLSLLGSLALLLVARGSFAAAYVVAPGGDDGGPGTDAAPWGTLQHAADTVAAGDVVTVKAGTFTGFYLETSGAAGSPITFSAEPGVLIDTENGTTPDGINLEGASYVVIEGFTVVGMPRTGIRAVLGDHVTLRSNKADQNFKWGILTGFCDDLLIEGNETSRSEDEHGIYVGNSGDRPVIRGNVVWGNNANGIHMNGDAEQGGDGVISDAIVEGNVIFGNGAAGGSAINCDGVQSSVIQNNLVYDQHSSGISLYQIDGGDSAKDNLVVNNTIVIASDGRWALNIGDGSTGNRAVNNVFFNEHASRGGISITADSLPGFTSDHNVTIDRFTPDGDSTIMTLAEWQAATGQDASSVVSDGAAVFAVPGTDFHQLAASPTLDIGLAADAPPTDLDGNARPLGAGVDVGAYELCEADCNPPGATAAASTGAGTSGAGTGAGATGAGGGATGAGATGGPGATASGAGGGDPLKSGDAAGDDGGCGCRLAGDDTGGSGALVAAAGLALAALLRRRRSSIA